MSQTVNTKWGAESCMSQASDIFQGIPHAGSFEDILVDEDEFPLPAKKACKVQIAEAGKGGTTSSTPKKPGTMWANTSTIPMPWAQQRYLLSSQQLSEYEEDTCHTLKAAASKI